MSFSDVPLSLIGHDDGVFHHMDGWGGGWMWLWGTLMMLSWVLIVAGAVYLVARAFRADRQPVRGGGARAILDERYARGEISSKEYEERLDHLRMEVGSSR